MVRTDRVEIHSRRLTYSVIRILPSYTRTTRQLHRVRRLDSNSNHRGNPNCVSANVSTRVVYTHHRRGRSQFSAWPPRHCGSLSRCDIELYALTEGGCGRAAKRWLGVCSGASNSNPVGSGGRGGRSACDSVARSNWYAAFSCGREVRLACASIARSQWTVELIGCSHPTIPLPGNYIFCIIWLYVVHNLLIEDVRLGSASNQDMALKQKYTRWIYIWPCSTVGVSSTHQPLHTPGNSIRAASIGESDLIYPCLTTLLE